MKSEKKQIEDYGASSLLSSVKNGYNTFAKTWNTTRQNNWYEFSMCAEHIVENDRVLDLGCGNGRFYGFLEQQKLPCSYEGIDNSSELVSIASTQYPHASFIVGDALHLPYEDDSFDFVTSFAVLHHITPASNRKKFFEEIHRVLKPGGQAFVTTWNVHKPKYAKYFTERLGARLLQYVRSPLDVAYGYKDCLIPFGEEKTLRYVHAFTPKELHSLADRYFDVQELYFTLKDALTDNWKESRNICIRLQKSAN